MKMYELTQEEELELLEIAMSGTDEPIIYEVQEWNDDGEATYSFDDIEELRTDADIISLLKAEKELGYKF